MIAFSLDNRDPPPTFQQPGESVKRAIEGCLSHTHSLACLCLPYDLGCLCGVCHWGGPRRQLPTHGCSPSFLLSCSSSRPHVGLRELEEWNQCGLWEEVESSHSSPAAWGGSSCQFPEPLCAEAAPSTAAGTSSRHISLLSLPCAASGCPSCSESHCPSPFPSKAPLSCCWKRLIHAEMLVAACSLTFAFSWKNWGCCFIPQTLLRPKREMIMVRG